jgi:serine/threonine-protein kinase
MTLPLSPRSDRQDTEVHPDADRGDGPARPDLGQRYEVQAEIARGGMGAVYRARDRALQRDLAVKVLLPHYADRPDVARRFLEEAQVAAQLQHPAIVPVHEMGTLADGRPFFTMKLVKGRTLAELLAARAGPQDDLPRFLGVFEQVCQAVAYAHSKGVIHRDLKPHNVMVGAFGEVQVMDWGLAKVLGAGDTQAPDGAPAPVAVVSVVETLRTAERGYDTQAGSALGTFGYMPPEQAKGQVARLDRRCDVFGLGAVLCEILTGSPPYAGDNPEELRSRAVLGDVGPALERLAWCGADDDLVALARSCLAADPAARPADAAAVADALRTYLDGVRERLRRAEVSRAKAQVKVVEERKRRRLALALAAAVLLLVTTGAAAAWWYQHDRDAHAADRAAREAQTELQVTAALHEAETLTDEGRRQIEDPERWQATAALAQSAVRRAEELLAAGAAAPGLEERVAAVRADADEAVRDAQLASALNRVRLEMADRSAGPKRGTAAAEGYAAAFRAYGVDPSQPEPSAERVRGSRVRDALLAGLDDWARRTTDRDEAGRIEALLRALEPDAGAPRPRWRAAREQGDRAALARLAEELAGRDLPPAALVNMADDLAELKEVVAAERLLRAGRERHPDDFWLNFQLAAMQRRLQPPRAGEAARFLTAALALRPRSKVVWNNLSVVLIDSGHPEEAARCARRALDLDPDYVRAHVNLGKVLRDQGDADGALRHYRRAVEIDPDNGQAQMNLGVALADRHDLAGAADHLRRAVALDAGDYTALRNLGFALRDQGDLDGALRALRRATEVAPGDVMSKAGLGQVQLMRGEYDEAQKTLRQALPLLPPTAPLHQTIAELVRDSEEMPALAQKLPAILKGDTKPSGPAEAIALARLCQKYRRQFAAAARLYAVALDDPKVADGLRNAHLYSAACAAALAGTGEDAAGLDERERGRLRSQALAWLRTDLAAWKEHARRGDPAPMRQSLRAWLANPDLATVRDRENLDKLPEGERTDWRRLWDEVAALAK